MSAGTNLLELRSPSESELLLKHLRVALEVVQLCPLGRQPFDTAGFETPLAEPVGSASGEDEQGVDFQTASLGLNVLQQLVAAATLAIGRVDSDAGQLRCAGAFQRPPSAGASGIRA